jgi:chromosome segregation ATPase
MLEIIGVFLSVLMVAIIVAAIQDCVVKMWGSVGPKNNQNDQLANHAQEVEFVIAQSQAVVAERDRTIDAQSDEIKHLHFALTERYNSLEELREKFQDLIQTSSHAEETLKQSAIQMDANLKNAIKESDTAYETLRMNYDQLHAAHKLLKHDRDMTTSKLTAMTLERDRLLEVIKLRDEKIDKLVARTNELNSQIDGLKYKFETRGGQSPDLNTAWHMKETPVDTKQKYLLDDTPLDENGSGVIDSQPYGE